MSLVQGVGDEVIFFFLFMFLLIVVLVLITLRAVSRNGPQTGERDRRSVVTQVPRIGHNGPDRESEDSRTASAGVRRYGVPGTVSDRSRPTFDTTEEVPDEYGASSDERGRVSKDRESLCGVASSDSRHSESVTHTLNSEGRGGLTRRVQDTFASTHMDPSRDAEEEVSTGNIWEAAEIEANGQELPPSHVSSTDGSRNEETDKAHRSVPTPASQDEETSDSMRICLVHFQQRTHITCSPEDTLLHLAEVHFRQELGDNVHARFIYCGRLLDAEAALRDHHLPPEAGVHIHFSNAGVSHSAQAMGTDPADLDISALFLPMLGLVLGAVWAVLLWKPALFTLLTKLMLYCLSFGYILLLYARFGRRANVARV